ncbi:GGDEF domain-containing protein [Acinetobacter tianfuensis]|uniref:diguanylate cyclase n=1 Tax=Acinetobacter tianfuensis TaxID=2419603 RepID=A0A3A8E7K0_9GAMM|nr:diguanylate cyclase [Acinetobacter tianfuensis]RKG29556.1 GGDEF domain-containing protein [Acinetobacter tianfuensis]
MKLHGSKLLSREKIEGIIVNGLNYVHFTSDLEPAYRSQYRNEAAYEFRFRAPIIFFLYAFLSYGIYQTIPSPETALHWFSLYAWVGFIVLAAWAMSFVNKLNEYFDIYTGFGCMWAVAISFIIIPVIGHDDDNALLHAAMMYAVVIIYSFVGLRFYTAVIAGWLGGFIGVVVSQYLHYEIDWTFLNRTYTFSSFLGMALAYAIDRQHRENYLQNCIIEINRLEMDEQAKQLEQLSQIDSLTGLANRRHLAVILDQQWRYAIRHQTPISVLMVDIDCFKNYNDTLGHIAGDACLKAIADELKNLSTRSNDLAARYGGEEFLLLFPMFDEYQVEALAQILIQRIQKLAIPHPSSPISPHVTISIGISSIVPKETNDMTSFIQAADQALYYAKSHGRNQYIIAKDIAA